MADAVGTVAVVEELAIPPPANQASLTLASAGESLVVGLATLESVSFFLGKNVDVFQILGFDEVCTVVCWQGPVSVV